MAGFSIKDIPVAKGNDKEPQLQRLILEAWDIIKKTNWDHTQYTNYCPQERVHFDVAKGFQMFYESEGWRVTINERPRNFHFTIYSN